MPYNTILSDPTKSSAYPGTMVVYADVPTSGLPRPDASHLATFLTFAATIGQHPGLGFGQLPPGYLPITAANGLASMLAYTSAAATYVSAQSATVPSITSPRAYVASGPGKVPFGTGGSSHVPTPAPTPSPSPSPTGSPQPSASSSWGPSTVALGTTSSVTWGASALVLPALLLVSLLAGLVASLIGYLGGRGKPTA